MKLATYGTPVGVFEEPVIGRIAIGSVEPEKRSATVIVIGSDSDVCDLSGYAGAMLIGDVPVEASLDTPTIRLRNASHLASGDVVVIQPTGFVRTIYRKNSKHNVIFATDRCDSLCLMCSQPPREVDDSDRIREHLRLVSLIDPDTPELGITGGEPTLLGPDFLRLIEACRTTLPQTAIHVLTNGRAFRRRAFAKALADVQHANLMLGIPLYSDVDSHHDYVVQARGAFDETVRGLLHLASYGVPIEIRIVVHQHTWQRLPLLSAFIYRNFPFVSQVAFMGLEMIGFAIPNRKSLWIDPSDYADTLAAAVEYLANRGIRSLIYNHQLCTLPRRVWKYSVRSISDWKQEYLPACAPCTVKNECGGFFASVIARAATSLHIQPII